VSLPFRSYDRNYDCTSPIAFIRATCPAYLYLVFVILMSGEECKLRSFSLCISLHPPATFCQVHSPQHPSLKHNLCLPLRRETKVYTHTKQQNYNVVYFNFYVLDWRREDKSSWNYDSIPEIESFNFFVNVILIRPCHPLLKIRCCRPLRQKIATGTIICEQMIWYFPPSFNLFVSHHSFLAQYYPVIYHLQMVGSTMYVPMNHIAIP
jgi:hypothetical protein